MPFLFLVVGFIVFILIATSISDALIRFKHQKELYQNWGKGEPLKEKDSEDSLKRSLFSHLNETDFDFFVDDQTWGDLDMQSLFRKIDISHSSLGSHYLYTQMRGVSFTQDMTLSILKNYFKTNFDTLIKTQLLFKGLGKKEETYIQSTLPTEPNSLLKSLFFHFFGILPVIGLILSIRFPYVGAIITLAAICFNILYHIVTKFLLDKNISELAYTMRTLAFSTRLAKTEFPLQDKLAQAVHPFRKARFLGYIFREKTATTIEFLLDYLCMMFMIPYISIDWLTRKITTHSENFETILAISGKTEMAISLLNYEETLPYFCIPILKEGSQPSITAKQLYHPLLDHAISNDLTFNQILLISGDNASGKSTYLKACAINGILAQTIGIALAEQFEMVPGVMTTTMTTHDNIDIGDSSFIAEVKAIKRMITSLTPDFPTYLFIDEIFKGTNTIERLAAATSIIQWLASEHQLAMISTHDIELTTLSDQVVKNYHFSGRTQDNKIIYDYLLKDGATTSRNAIEILQIEDFPQSIITTAEKLITYYEENHTWRLD